MLGEAGGQAGAGRAAASLQSVMVTSASHPRRVSITQIVLTLRPYTRAPPPRLAPLGGYVYINFITHLVRHRWVMSLWAYGDIQTHAVCVEPLRSETPPLHVRAALSTGFWVERTHQMNGWMDERNMPAFLWSANTCAETHAHSDTAQLDVAVTSAVIKPIFHLTI